MKIIETGDVLQIKSDNLKTHDKLPVGFYSIRCGQFTGFYLEKHAPIEVNEEKIYGVHEEKIEKVFKTFKIFSRNLGVILSGEKGIGKSFIMTIFAKHLVSRRKGHFVYVDARNLIPSMIELSFKDKDAFLDDLDLLKTVDYLFIDNLGEEEKNDFSKESIIYEVLKERKDNNLPTYITSIYSLKDLFGAYRTPKSGNFKTKDIVSFIESTSTIINIQTSSKIASGIFKK